MSTEVLQVDPAGEMTEPIRAAAEVLRRGGLVAFPTDTVYGLGVRADDPSALQRLRSVKSRPADQAFTVHIATRAGSERYAPALSGVAARLARKAWPGPLTLIIPADENAVGDSGLNPATASAVYYQGTVGLRCPDCPVAQSLLASVEAPVVAASANRAGAPPPLSAPEVLADLGGQIDLVLDAGPTRYTVPSTIVRTSGASFEVLRLGVYDERAVREMASLRLLFLCTGNTCRSPMAEGLARAALAELIGCSVSELGAHGATVDSAGAFGNGGSAADPAIAVMRKRGIDLTAHRSQSVTPSLIERADHVFGMTRSHIAEAIGVAPSAKARVRLLLDDEEVSDPFGGSEQDYEHAARAIEAGIRARLKEIAI